MCFDNFFFQISGDEYNCSKVRKWNFAEVENLCTSMVANFDSGMEVETDLSTVKPSEARMWDGKLYDLTLLWSL